WRAAHSERMRDLFLGNSLTRREPPLPDRVAQAGEDEFAARGVAQRIRCGRSQLARLQRHNLGRWGRCHRRRVSLALAASLYSSIQLYTVLPTAARPIVGAQRPIGV